MPTADYVLYIVPGDASSENAKDLAVLPSDDHVVVDIVDYRAIPAASRPKWLAEGYPVLAHMRAGPDGVWTGPVWQGTHVFNELRTARPNAAENITTTLNHRALQPPLDNRMHGGLAPAPEDDDHGLAISAGLPCLDEDPRAAIDDGPLTAEQTNDMLASARRNAPTVSSLQNRGDESGYETASARPPPLAAAAYSRQMPMPSHGDDEHDF
jgi:hypothetical protein